jgi:hypothetical protein
MPIVSHPPVRRVALLALVVAMLFGSVAVAAPAPADAQALPADATSWVVSVGDSYISGEGGRWAGNRTGPTGAIDALGSTAYNDNADGTAETISMCHRSNSAAIHIGDGVNSLNLACSGATTKTVWEDKDGNFKPGIDFAQDGTGRKGQAQMLKEFAATNPVKMVVLSIGGNDFNFGDMVKTCVTDYANPLSIAWWRDYCSEDSSVTDNVSPTRADEVRRSIEEAIGRVQTAMHDAGVVDGTWTLVVNTYPQVLPYAANFRYWQVGDLRQMLGGCGFWDADANWAVNNALGTINRTVRNAVANVRIAAPTHSVALMDNSVAFDQRALCDENVGRVGTAATPGFFSAVNDWKDPNAVDDSEWVTEINWLNPGKWLQQESLHPNYWGQMALRNCVRQVWNGGTPVGGTCTRGTGKNAKGEPNMALTGKLVAKAPVATPDRYTVSNGAMLVEAHHGVLAGDVDHPERVLSLPVASFRPAALGDVAADDEGYALPVREGGLSATLVSETSHGTLRFAADGSFHYEPEQGFTGTDTFTYVASDFHGTSEPATVSLEVQGTTADADSGSSPSPANGVILTPSFTG